jgi:hypothetical protein
LREKAGLSQGEMAHQFAKVSPSMPMLETSANGFKITISELMKGV